MDGPLGVPVPVVRHRTDRLHRQVGVHRSKHQSLIMDTEIMKLVAVTAARAATVTPITNMAKITKCEPIGAPGRGEAAFDADPVVPSRLRRMKQDADLGVPVSVARPRAPDAHPSKHQN